MAAAEPPESQSTKDVLEQFYAAVAASDEEALARLVHEDAELHQPPNLPYGGVYRRDQMLTLWRDTIIPMVDGPTSFVDGLFVDGERAVVISGATLKRNREAVLACEDYVVRDGRITRIRMFWHDPTPVIDEANRHAGVAGA